MIAAMIPVADAAAANATLEAQGFGPNNFSLPVYTDSPGPKYAALHAGGNNLTDFFAAVKAIPNVVWSEAEVPSADLIDAALSGVGGKWQPQVLEGQAQAGNLYIDFEGRIWWCIQSYDTAIWPDPTAIPALIRRARVPGTVQPWVQPLDAFDAYKLVNPFTGGPDQVTHSGQTWRVVQADGAGNNTWEPGVFGWTAV